MTHPPVPFDAELIPTLTQMAPPGSPPPRPEDLPAMRAEIMQMLPSDAEVIAGRSVRSEERLIPGPDGELEVTILSPTTLPTHPVPALYNIHGGGMIMGHRRMDTSRLVDLVLELGVVAVNIEYRLAPEHPDPAPVEDCYAGLVWLHENAAELGVDPDRIVVMGGSAGGGLSAGVSLLARDRGGPALAGQLLLCPMIDDTNTTISSHQYAGLGTWPREHNLIGWACLLGDRTNGSEVSPYAAPTRAPDLSNLPPAYIEVGSAEAFRDEDVEYAMRIWATGGQAELHVWSGGFHGFDIYAPEAQVSRDTLIARSSWLKRVLGL